MKHPIHRRSSLFLALLLPATAASAADNLAAHQHGHGALAGR